MKKSTIIIGAILVVLGAAAGYCVTKYCTAPKRTLTILHTNDTHSHMEPIRSGEHAGLGGVLERAAYIDSVRKADGPENVLLLHAGDFSQGTTYFSEFRGAVENEVMNALGYDAVTLGNHEFDNGLEALGERLASLNAPVVVCNYDFSPFEAGKYIKPYVVVEKAGMKIGIIGATCNLKDVVSAEIVNRLPEFNFVETVQKYVDELRPTCDLIVLLTHLGYTPHLPGNTTDPIMAAATRGVDIIVGGHSHTFMDAADMVPNLDGEPVPVVQAGEWGVNMGEFHVSK